MSIRNLTRLPWVVRYIFFFLLFPYSNLHPVIILVHGTFASNATWYRPWGEFYTVLFKSAAKQGEVLVPFQWSGSLSDRAREDAAQSLAALVLSYPDSEKIILIGHSHGGNVINITSNLIESSHLFLKAKKNHKKKKLIDQVFLLATPVSEESFYTPCMNVIGHVYNLYSIGDLIQKSGGFYDQTYERKNRLINVLVKMARSGEFGSDDPTHDKMHSPQIAHSLLTLPVQLDHDEKTVWFLPDQAFVHSRNLDSRKVPGTDETSPTDQVQSSTEVVLQAG